MVEKIKISIEGFSCGEVMHFTIINGKIENMDGCSAAGEYTDGTIRVQADTPIQEDGREEF